jgi:SPP1 family phage portal protein
MTREELDYYKKVWEDKISKCLENEAYVMGKNPTIYSKKKMKDPDNRIAIPLAKSAVEDMTGFAAKEGNIKINYIDADEKYTSVNKEIYEYNDADLETTELYNQGITQGESYELFWVNDDKTGIDTVLTPEFAMVDNKEIVLVWSKDIKPSLEAALRFTHQRDILFADVYYPYMSEQWYLEVKNDSLGNKKEEWIRNEEGDTIYPYKSVPLNVYKTNRHSQPLFEAEKDIIDAHDNLISSSVNEVDRFNALIALFPNKVDKAFVQKLQEMKIIDGLGEFDKWPAYLEKSLSNIDAFYTNLADRLERLYHKTIKVPDFSDENFSGNSSGVALEYKIMGLEFKASQIDAYFNKGLIRRQEIIDNVLGENNSVKYKPARMEITNKRNLPINKIAQIDTAIKLMTLLSKETVLRMIPEDIVSDVEEELRKIEDEMGDMPKLTGNEEEKEGE